MEREGQDSTLLSIGVIDTVTGGYVGKGINGTFWIENKTGWFEYNTSTNSSGYLNYLFDPGCEYGVGKITWIGGTRDVCYVDTNATNTLNIT